MNATLDPQEIVKSQASQFAKFYCALLECTEDIQAIVTDMVAIAVDKDSTAEEKDLALETIVEALVHGFAYEIRTLHSDLQKCCEHREAAEELERQEQHFACKLRELMQIHGLTQEQLAERAGVGQPAISNILTRGCRPQQRTVLRFAEAFDVDPAELWPSLEDNS